MTVVMMVMVDVMCGDGGVMVVVMVCKQACQVSFTLRADITPCHHSLLMQWSLLLIYIT